MNAAALPTSPDPGTLARTMSFLTAGQVRAFRDRSPGPVLIDVRLPEAYDAAHIAGALNACVFLVSFTDDVRRLVPDLTTPVIVYGSGPSSFESTDAARRLQEAGYSVVHNFPGGLLEWRADGFPTLGQGPLSDPPRLEGTIPLVLEETKVEWTGRNLLNKHRGSVQVTSGHLVFRDGWLSGGALEIDLNSIACNDIADPNLNRLLIGHLKSADFFDVARHPRAQLVIKRAAPVADGRPGAPNLQLVCDLTLRGVTREIGALAVAGRTPEGALGAQSLLVLDRTDWGSSYGSGRFFEQLGRHLVNDHFEIEVRLVAAPGGVPAGG